MDSSAPDLASNANTYWSAILVDELAHAGLQAVCIAPGSRSTPLTLAFAAHPGITVYPHLDERSAGFFALGLAQASGRPVALVCTSGTAAANFHPAVIEAFHAHIPLLVLTADRPPELRDSGANQTIDQIKLYGDHVLWSVDLPVPQPDVPEVVLLHLRTLAARAYATAAGLRQGPVHLNAPFRKPLEPRPGEESGRAGGKATTASGIPHTRYLRGRLLPTQEQIDRTAELLSGQPHGMIVCGPNCPGDDFPAAVTDLARRTGYPILADPLSGVRFGPHVGTGALIMGGYDLALQAAPETWPSPDIVIRFGDVPTSAALNNFLDAVHPGHYLHIRPDGVWADDLHRVRTYWQAEPVAACEGLAARLAERRFTPGDGWLQRFEWIESRTQEAVDRALQEVFFDATALRQLLAWLASRRDIRLFVGNSLPVRHLDAYGRPAASAMRIFGNRGASGIDGNVSTALGVAAAEPETPLVALLGDVTFYHDMNGLLALRRPELRQTTIVVFNNNGGGIFRRLPIAQFDPPFTELFLAPHDLDFRPAAQLYGLTYARAADPATLQAALNAREQNDPAPRLIEIPTDDRNDLDQHRRVIAAVAENLRAADASRRFATPVPTLTAQNHQE